MSQFLGQRLIAKVKKKIAQVLIHANGIRKLMTTIVSSKAAIIGINKEARGEKHQGNNVGRELISRCEPMCHGNLFSSDRWSPNIYRKTALGCDIK